MTIAMTPLLTERDHAILVGLVRQGGLHTATYLQQLHEKLQTAEVVPLEEVEPDLATFGSFVRYRVNEGRSMEHKLALHPRRGQEQHTISIRTARGLALLGMREGQIFTARQSQDVHESIEIEMIMFQPEADGEQLRPEAFGS